MPSGTLAVLLLRALCLASLHGVRAALTTGVGNDPGAQAFARNHPQVARRQAFAKRQRQLRADVPAQTQVAPGQAAKRQGQQHANVPAQAEAPKLEGWDKVAAIAGLELDPDALAPALQAWAPTSKPQAAKRQGQLHAKVPARVQAVEEVEQADDEPAAQAPAPAPEARAPANRPKAASRPASRGRKLRAEEPLGDQPALPVLPSLLCPPEMPRAESYEEKHGPSKASVPVIMQRGGKYGHNSPTQRRFLMRMEPGILRSVSEGAVVLDLGCADGINSMHMLKAIKNAAFNFTMAFVDLPGNDWQTVRKTVSNVVMDVFPREGGAGKPDIMDSVPGMFGSKVALIGESFFKQVAPNNSVNVAFSSTALHYLSHENTGGDRTQQAAQDWEAFLRARSRELVVGGRLHITALASNQQGVNPGAVWDVMQNVLSEAVLKGIISIAQRLSWQWPAYARTEDEWRLPFDQKKFPRLKMESFDIVLADTPYWAQAMGNACIFSSLYVPSVMAWIEPHLRRTFSPAVIDLFRRRLKENVELDPAKFKPDLFQGMMTIRKTAGPLGAMNVRKRLAANSPP